MGIPPSLSPAASLDIQYIRLNEGTPSRASAAAASIKKEDEEGSRDPS